MALVVVVDLRHDAIVAVTELIVWERDGRVQKVRVPDGGLTIGRKPAEHGASYCTTNPSVSRTHCRIAKSPDGWLIEDLGSSSGTKINGELANGSTLIQIGDVVMIGDREGGLTAQLVDVAPPPLPSAIRASLITIDEGTEDRARSFAELRRVIKPDGYFLHSFFISAPDQVEGSMYHLQKWFGHAVDLPTYFVSIEDASDEMDRGGFDVVAVLVREPTNTKELPTRRCYMLGKRRA